MVQRINLQRPVPKRNQTTRGTTSLRPRAARQPKTTLTNIKKAQKTKQEILSELDKNVEDIVKSQPKITKDLSKEIIKKNISKIPPSLRGKFRATVEKQVSQAESAQKSRINKWKNQIKRWEKLRERYDEQDRRARELDYQGRVKKGEEILRRLKKGEKIDLNAAERVARQVGSQERQERRFEERKKEIRATESKVNTFIQKQVEKGETPQIIDIKKRFDLSLKQAKDVRDIIQKEAKKTPTKNLLDKFNENIAVGLKNLNVPTQMSLSPKTVKELESQLNFMSVEGVRKGDIKSFNQLSPSQRDTVLSYSIVRQAQKALPKQSEIQDIKKQDEFFDKTKELNKKLRKELKYVNVPAAPEIDKVLSDKDAKNIKFLRSLSKEELKKRVLRGNTKQINEAISSLNRFYKNRDKTQEQIAKDLLKKVGKQKIRPELSNLAKIASSAIPGLRSTLENRPLRTALLSAIEKDIKERKKRGSFSVKDYKETVALTRDLFGLKKLGKRIAQKYKRTTQGKKAPKAILDVVVEFAKIGKNVGVNAGQVLARDIKAIIEFAKEVGGINLRNAMIRDATDQMKAVIKKMPKSERKKFFSRTKKQLKKWADRSKNLGQFTKILFNNPEQIATGIALASASGVKNIRSTIINKPERAAAEILSVFAPDAGILLVKAAKKPIKAARLAKFSKRIKKGVDPNIRLTDFQVEKLKFLDDNLPTGAKFYLTKDNSYLITLAQKNKAKQLKLLQSDEFKRLFPKLQLDDALKGADAKTFRSVIKDADGNTLLTVQKPNKLTQSKLGGFDSRLRNIDFKKQGLKKNIKPLKKQLRETKIPDFDQKKIQFEIGGEKLTVYLNKKNATGKKLQKLFKSKKGQQRLRLLQKQDVKKFKRYLDDGVDALRKQRKLVRSSKLANKSKTLLKIARAIKALLSLKQYLTQRQLSKLQAKKADKLKKTAKAKIKGKARAKAKTKAQTKGKTLKKTKKKPVGKIKTKKPTDRTRLRVPRAKKPTWTKKLDKGLVRIVNPLIRRRGQIRELKLETTPNRALREAIKEVDKSPARSFQLKIVDVAQGKDIKKPASLKKFRRKKPRRGSRVLTYVEKTKYALDTPTERKALKKARKKKKNVKKKRKKR